MLVTTHSRFPAALWLLLAGCGDDAPSDDGAPPPPGVDAGGSLDLDGAAQSQLDATTAADASLRDDASLHDAANEPDAPSDGAAGGAPACTVSASSARCETRTVEMIGKSGDLRRVYWNRPAASPPEAGQPAVILFQGSYVGPATTWNTPVASGAAFGGYYQVALIAKLLERGFVVIQPEANGGLFWSTNTGGDYGSSADGVFMPLLLDALENGTFGKLDPARLYATGISSGGYMTSRMAVSYPGKFRALAIQSGSYATCLGPLCNVPAQLPADHPPTLLLHGAADLTVGIATARDYEQKLKASGIEAAFEEDPAAGHQWLKTAPERVSAWFEAH